MLGRRSSAVCLLGLALLATAAARTSTLGDRLASTAAAFIATLSDDQRPRAVFAFDAAGRTDWHFVPRDRPGLKFSELSDESRRAVHALLRSALSGQGYLKTTGIIQLEQVLFDSEVAAGRDPAWRDPGNYTIAVYGDPGAKQPWAWKFEGHHICLNYTSAADDVAVTPAFLGANPAVVQTGPRAGLSVLVAEERIGRELLGSLDAGQRTQAVISDSAPNDIVLAPRRPLDLGTPRGVTYASMTADQRAIFERLLAEYIGNLEHDLAQQQWDRIREKGLDEARFAWCGSDQPGRPHYYRIHGPGFVIEYDNTQNNANHVHTCWHDLERDFGADLLKAHYEHGHRHSDAPRR
ncbi:MAG: hypothetical protein AMXMBFR58_23200 [Phycisphaerae bacterium]